jgi:hypothetical protein
MINRPFIELVGKSKFLPIVGIVNVVGHTLFYFYGSEMAKWHIMFWQLYLIFIIACRIIFKKL